MKVLLLLILTTIKFELAFGQFPIDTIFIVNPTYPSYETMYNLLVSKKDEIELKGGWVDEDIQEFARRASESSGDVYNERYKENINKKLRKRNIQTVWINENEKAKYFRRRHYLEFGYQAKIFKKGGKMMGPTLILHDTKGQVVIEDFFDNFFKKLKKYKS